MDLQWKIDIINGLIKENPESTIANYLALLEEIGRMERGEPELPGYLPGPIKTKWPFARLIPSEGLRLTKGEHGMWQFRDRMFFKQLRKLNRPTTRRKALTSHFETEIKQL